MVKGLLKNEYFIDNQINVKFVGAIIFLSAIIKLN